MRNAYLKLAFAASLLLPLVAPAASQQARTSHGLDLAGMDKSVNPGDDFFAYANGGWLKSTEIPPDRAGLGAFSAIDEVVSRRTAELISEAARSHAPAGSEARKIGDYYAAFMDERTIESKGLAPLKPELDRINAANDKAALARLLGAQLRADVDPLNNTNFYTDRLFGLWV
jgi:putative endopeptidase